ncbi:helix-turn-helix transcriptional regulator [Coraliomargarita parva]|uniref:helix-turn-helix transcriptional regulator n=1 Tax=Coraliomargarita parva TaxID=3014050 RepID=UPI0022B400AF|nr:WYL domain-containing transcriptional regulator [Coraliomargarita parva]
MPRAKRSAPVSRPPLARMLRIHEELKANRLPNASTLSKLLETSTKTINRDINYMRDQLGLPVEWDAPANGYRYTSYVDSFPLVQVSEGELFALLVAQKALEPYQGTPFHAPLETAMRKISDGLKDKVFISLDHIGTPVSFKFAGVSTADLEIFQIVNRALVRSEELHFEYKNLGTSKWLKRRVQPWHLCCVEGQWYLVGWDLNREAKRTFALVRMQKLMLPGKSFEAPKDFDIQQHLKDAFGIFVGEERHKIRIEFDAWAAQLIREKAWHPAQELIDLEDGRVEFRIELADLNEIERWILSWGSHAKVLAPAKLKKNIRAHAEAMLAKA